MGGIGSTFRYCRRKRVHRRQHDVAVQVPLSLRRLLAFYAADQRVQEDPSGPQPDRQSHGALWRACTCCSMHGRAVRALAHACILSDAADRLISVANRCATVLETNKQTNKQVRSSSSFVRSRHARGTHSLNKTRHTSTNTHTHTRTHARTHAHTHTHTHTHMHMHTHTQSLISVHRIHAHTPTYGHGALTLQCTPHAQSTGTHACTSARVPMIVLRLLAVRLSLRIS